MKVICVLSRPAWDCSRNLSNAEKNNFSGTHKREIWEEKLSSDYCGRISKFFEDVVLIVISLVFSSIYRTGNIRIYSNKNVLTVITGVFATGHDFLTIHCYTIYRTGFLFWFFNVTLILMEYLEVKKIVKFSCVYKG